MNSHKSRTSKARERVFPHIVEIAVPLDGLGSRLDDMHAWNLEHGIKIRTRMVSKSGSNYVRWCFLTASVATAFVRKFGGKIAP